MTDDARKPEDQEKQLQEAAASEGEAKTPDEAAAAETASTESKRGSFISRWGWIFVLAIAVGVALMLLPEEVRQKWFANGNEAVEEIIAPLEQAISTNSPAPEKAEPSTASTQPKSTTEPAKAEPVVEPAPVKPAPVTLPERKPATSNMPGTPTEPKVTVIKREGLDTKEAQRLLHAMNNLQQELSTLRSEQQSLRQTQTELQRIQLRTRLGWIANPVNHLPQIELALEEISRMPTLSADERNKAQEMYTLAQKRHADIERWQQAMNEAAARLRPEMHKNIIPQFEQPWLKRLFGQFSLKRAPEAEAQQMQLLQQQLQGAARQIQKEQWPDPVAWQKLRAHVQLALADLPGSTIDNMPKLPDSFSDIARDIEQLRQAAQTWQEQL